jgi:DNA (cytosine-5)-methyltransferase 1
MRIGGTGNPKPLTLPLMTQTTRHEAAIVFPNAGNTFERTPGNRARAADRSAMDTVHTTLDRAVVIPPMGEADPRLTTAPLPTQTSTTRSSLVTAPDPDPVAVETGEAPLAGEPAWIMRNNGDSAGEQTTPAHEPVRTLTAGCHQSLLVPYYRTGSGTDPATSPAPTVPTKDRLALVVPADFQRGRKNQGAAPEKPHPVPRVTEADIDNCRFRMLDLPEIADAMGIRAHVDGRTGYVVLGNRRERMAQYGNAVTPPAMQLLVGRHLAVLNAG